MNLRPSYRSIVATSYVAGVYSLVVCGLLIYDALDRSSAVPLDAPRFQQLKARLAAESDRQGLRKAIRELDLTLRQEYFRELRYTGTGTYLLLAGVVIALASAKWATVSRRKLPAPGAPDRIVDSDSRLARYGVWAVAAVVLALLTTTWALRWGLSSNLPERRQQLAAWMRSTDENPSGSGHPDAPRSRQQPASAGVGQLPSLPSDEQRQQYWPAFRGPDGSGVSRYTDILDSWDGASGEGVVWKTPIPLPGNSSPILWRDRVFLTAADQQQQVVYCFDTEGGQLVWQQQVVPEQSGRKCKVNDETGYASPTPATDGRLVYVAFASGDVAAYDFSGTQIWIRSLGVPRNVYGHAASLATYQDRLIVQFDQGTKKDDLSRLLALDGATGSTIWEQPRKAPSSWSSPVVIDHDGQPRLVTVADPWAVVYSPEDGSEVWRADCLEGDVGPSPVYAEGVYYFVSEYPALSAFKAGGQGDVSESHLLWSVDLGLPDTSSPLVTQHFVLLLTSYGTLTCYDREQGGDPLWEEDFEDTFSSSPGLVGNRVYLFSQESGRCWVVEPTSSECRRISESNLGEPCVTSPAFQQGRIYVRGQKHLFCLGKPSTATRRP